MSCEICENCMVGGLYQFLPGICYICSSPVPEKSGTYLGKDGDIHVFQVEIPFTCQECGTFHEQAGFYCGDMNVTEEFVQEAEPSEHWIGKNARR